MPDNLTWDIFPEVTEDMIQIPDKSILPKAASNINWDHFPDIKSNG